MKKLVLCRLNSGSEAGSVYIAAIILLGILGVFGAQVIASSVFNQSVAVQPADDLQAFQAIHSNRTSIFETDDFGQLVLNPNIDIEVFDVLRATLVANGASSGSGVCSAVVKSYKADPLAPTVVDCSQANLESRIVQRELSQGCNSTIPSPSCYPFSEGILQNLISDCPAGDPTCPCEHFSVCVYKKNTAELVTNTSTGVLSVFPPNF